MIEKVSINAIKSNPNNPRVIRDDKFRKLVKSINEFPEMLELRPIVVNDNMIVLGGNMRLKACIEAGLDEVAIIKASNLSEAQQAEFIIKDNVGFGEWDWDMLANEYDEQDLKDWGLDLPIFDKEEEDVTNKKLSDRFIIPPFSVLDTKQGTWQQRKNYWLSLGIKSELGREGAMTYGHNGKDEVSQKITNMKGGTSIFDPVLCELSYKWFNIPNGKILDPFAGGSVRGIVAAKLGYNYLGNDLRAEQIEANIINAKEVLSDNEIYPVWTCGDSLNIDKIAKDYQADMIYSCPPYSDLEVYSDAKEDISNMSYKDFIDIYRQIIKKSCDKLKDDRFAVFVVGDVRDKKGFYRNFVSNTIEAFELSGMQLYNEMVLVNSIGTLAIIVGKQFSCGRKVGKQHQNVLVFYKGNPKKIKENYPELDLSYINDIEFEDEEAH
jgi:DNA modification methylase